METENISAGYYEKNQFFGEKYVKLKNIANINPKREKPIFKLDKEVPYVGLPETDKGEIQEINYRPFKEIRGRNIIKKGDILFARIEPSIFNKKYIYVDEKFNLDFAYTSTEFYIIEAKEGVNNKYIYNLLFHDEVYNQFSGKTTGSTGRRRLDKNTFENIKIPLPPIEIQNQIVKKMDQALEIKKQKETEAKNLLESIDDFVLSELGIKYEEIKEKKVFEIGLSEFGENKRFDTFYNNPKFTELEEILKKGKYEVNKINDFLEYYKKGIEVGSKEYKSEGIPFVRVSDIDNFGINFDNCDKFISEKKYLDLINYKPKEGEILFSKDGTIGLSCIVNNEENFIISGGILRLKVKENINNLFLSYFLNTKFLNKFFERKSIGAIIKHLDLKSFENLEIPLPPLEVQQKIASEVKSRIETAEKLQQEAKEIYESAKKEVEGIILER